MIATAVQCATKHDVRLALADWLPPALAAIGLLVLAILVVVVLIAREVDA